MDNNFNEKKYLKYKKKYLNIKYEKQYGGGFYFRLFVAATFFSIICIDNYFISINESLNKLLENIINRSREEIENIKNKKIYINNITDKTKLDSIPDFLDNDNEIKFLIVLKNPNEYKNLPNELKKELEINIVFIQAFPSLYYSIDDSLKFNEKIILVTLKSFLFLKKIKIKIE